MKNILFMITFAAAFLLNIDPAGAAPIPPAGPFDISGTIREIKWFPEQSVQGKRGMSGALGHDRVFPAHFVVKLVRYKGVAAEDAVRITRYVSYNAYGDANPPGMPPFVILKIDSNDRNLLKTGMRVRIKGYTVRGDEGGTWTSYSRIVTR